MKIKKDMIFEGKIKGSRFRCKYVSLKGTPFPFAIFRRFDVDFGYDIIVDFRDLRQFKLVS